MDTSYMVTSYGETSGFVPASSDELESTNGGGGSRDNSGSSERSSGCTNSKCSCHH